MLNKIKLVGKVLPIEIKERENREKKLPIVYFSLLVPNPSGSITILRCVAQGEIAERIENEVKEEVLEIRGYLRNENNGRQILIKVIEFEKLNIDFDNIDNERSNKVYLLGKIITDLRAQQENENSEILSFKIVVPREGNAFPVFFCRAQGKLIPKINDKLKKGDIIILEGFLQTKKNVKDGGDIERASSIICRGFTFIDSDSVNIFSPFDKLTHIVEEVKKIDFTKPKE